MRWLRWLPWKFLVSRAARAHGFLDPIGVLAQLQRFAQPSEVNEPVELLRAGVVLHARGFINSRVIQHNLDWVWPYWVERQFDPHDVSFTPRAFSITHINLTHRNWTAVGVPDQQELPIVDPRGLVTPLFDKWSLDAWVVADDGRRLLPSRADVATQRLELDDGVTVVTESAADRLALTTRVDSLAPGGRPECRLRFRAAADADGWAVLSLRPYNPEGISFIHKVRLVDDRHAWTVDGRARVAFSDAADRHHVSDYRAGDVAIHLQDLDDQEGGSCGVGMVTAAALFRLQANEPREIVATVSAPPQPEPVVAWRDSLNGHCQLDVPDEHFQFLYDAAVRTLLLHSPDDVFPGSYTYKRFWFRDAAFIIHGLLCLGLDDRAERAIDRFPARQTPLGYFHSQDGEWDSNGEALWTIRRYCELTGRDPKAAWRKAIVHGGKWIGRKRLRDDASSPHAGLLPAGFSAEHLGPNDYYYWDDFWGVAGLEAAAGLADAYGDGDTAADFRRQATDFTAAIDRSIAQVAERLGGPAIPASPYRRMDAGAIGSVAIGYPLQLCPPDDARLQGTVSFLLQNCFVDGGFFQDMIHSGINPYLTLHVAQVLLRAGDPRFLDCVDSVAALASPTGQWPEAIHPRTRGGCMGDGQHVWAAVEWILMLRNMIVREEAGHLVVGGGIPARWLTPGRRLRFGPAPTSFGTVTIAFGAAEDRVDIEWNALWHGEPAPVRVRLAGCDEADIDSESTRITVPRRTRS